MHAVLPALLQKKPVGHLFLIYRRDILREILRDFGRIFRTHKMKAQKFRGKFRSTFREKILLGKRFDRSLVRTGVWRGF